MRDMEPTKVDPLTLHGTPGATAILLRQYFFALRLLEEGPRKVSSLKSVQNLLSGMGAARECPLVRVRLVPGRLDGAYFCRALGQQQTPRGKAEVACCPSGTIFWDVN
jgi:hypothetical protein